MYLLIYSLTLGVAAIIINPTIFKTVAATTMEKGLRYVRESEERKIAGGGDHTCIVWQRLSKVLVSLVEVC